MQRPLAFTVLTATAAIAGFAAVATSPASTPITPVGTNLGLSQCVEGPHVSALFAPGTDPKIVEMVSQAIMNPDNSRYEITSRWPGSSGTPVDLTYSFPADGLSIPSGVGEGVANNTLNATMIARFGSVAAGKAKVAQVFAKWAEYTGNTYTEVSDDNAAFFSSPGPLHGGSGRGDIRLAAKPMDGGGGVLAYNFFPGSTGGEMVLDNAENWGSSFNDFRFFRNTVAHEHGHGQGILHVCPIQQNKLMEPFLSTSFDGPRHDDIRATQFHYGDFLEPNDNPASATFMGFFAADGSAGETGISIKNGSDNDYFSVDLDGPGTISFSVTPTGATYLSGPQTQQCNTGTSINTLTQIDLEITIFDTDGTTVLANANAADAGFGESLSNIAAPSAGTYYAHVKSDLAFTGGAAQLYNFSLDVTINPVVACVGDINGDGVADTADLGILITAFGAIGANAADLNGDMVVDTADLGILITVFGTCTPV
jgi:hypothetical protein